MTPETVELNTRLQPTAKSSVSIGLAAPATNPGQRPPLFIGRDEVFFWTATWQRGEAESEAEREAGNLRRFKRGEDFLAWLRAPDD